MASVIGPIYLRGVFNDCAFCVKRELKMEHNLILEKRLFFSFTLTTYLDVLIFEL